MAWRHYEAWCAALGREPLAADGDTIAMYVVRCADQGLAVSSTRVAHLLAGLSRDLRHPRRAMVLEGVTRSKEVRPRRQASPRRAWCAAPDAGCPPRAGDTARRPRLGDAAARLRRRPAPL